MEGGSGAQVPNFLAGPKSKIAAGLLGIFLGTLGIHSFYLCDNRKGLIHLVLALCGFIPFTYGLLPVASGIWGIYEAVMILLGNVTVDARGNPIR